MRSLSCLIAVALSTCVPGSRGQIAAQEQDKSIVFPDFSAHFPIVFGAQGQPYELDGVTLRAIATAANDFLPMGSKDQPCWERQDAHRYQVIRRGDIIFVRISQDPAKCDKLFLDGSRRYAISVDGRILRSLSTGEPDGSSNLGPADSGVQGPPGEPVPTSLVGNTLLGGPGFIPPQWLDGGIGSIPQQPRPPLPASPDGGADVDGGPASVPTQ
jgi:hypothetical protein